MSDEVESRESRVSEMTKRTDHGPTSMKEVRLEFDGEEVINKRDPLALRHPADPRTIGISVAADESASAGRPSGKPLILIADDQPGIRNILSMMLSPLYSVAEASDGEKGLSMALELVPDIAIIDLVMPKRNGIELVRTMRQHPALSVVPVISMSGYEELAPKREMVELGIVGHLTKPFSIVDVSELVERALAKSSDPEAGVATEQQEGEPMTSGRTSYLCSATDFDGRWAALMVDLLLQFAPEAQVPGGFHTALDELVREIEQRCAEKVLFELGCRIEEELDPTAREEMRAVLARCERNHLESRTQ